MPESNRCSESSQSDELAVERRSVMLVDKQAQRRDSLTLDAGRESLVSTSSQQMGGKVSLFDTV